MDKHNRDNLIGIAIIVGIILVIIGLARYITLMAVVAVVIYCVAGILAFSEVRWGTRKSRLLCLIVGMLYVLAGGFILSWLLSPWQTKETFPYLAVFLSVAATLIWKYGKQSGK